MTQQNKEALEALTSIYKSMTKEQLLNLAEEIRDIRQALTEPSVDVEEVISDCFDNAGDYSIAGIIKHLNERGLLRTGWQPIDTAPLDEIIIGKYGDSTSLVIWSDNPVCMLGARNGSYPAGWATASIDTDGNLPMDEPDAWMPYTPPKGQSDE